MGKRNCTRVQVVWISFRKGADRMQRCGMRSYLVQKKREKRIGCVFSPNQQHIERIGYVKNLEALKVLAIAPSDQGWHECDTQSSSKLEQ